MNPLRAEETGISRNTLKIIAIVAMVVDHVGEGFVSHDTRLYDLTQFIGFITGPVFFYFIAEGYRHTRNVNRYTRNLAIFALVSYLPFAVYFYGKGGLDGGDFFRLNVMYTLLIGLLIIRVRHEIRRPWLRALLFILLFLLSAAGDWPFFGPLIILTFDLYYGDRQQQLFGYSLVMLFYMANIIFGLIYPFSTFFHTAGHPLVFDLSRFPGFWQYFGVFLPAILLANYQGKIGRRFAGEKWGFYIFYPAHLVVLILIRYVIL
jgi:hypothetical protein